MVRGEIEERITALTDSYNHGLEARNFCGTDADRAFTDQVMSDLKTQIALLRAQLKSFGTDGKTTHPTYPANRRCRLS
jgi:hypothetical protein